MRLTSALTLSIVVLLCPACGDSGGDETGAAPASTTSSSTDSPTTGGLTTGEPTTGTSTGEPITTGPSEPGTATTGTTAEPGTATSTGTVDSTGEPSTASASESSDDTGPPPPGGACESDADCALHDDCCDCYAIPAGQDDPICKKGCDQTTCELLGIDQAVCRFGVCTTERTGCDASLVTCKSLPPDCPEGQVPGVAGECWTGQCVPALSCDVVPDCGVCPDGSMCVQKIAKPKTTATCEPIPGECGGEVDCKCAGVLACTGIFTACNDLGDDLACGCPVC